MKKIGIVIIAILFSANCFCQDDIFAEDKVDDMTGKSILRTEWMTIKMEMSKNYYARFCKVDNFIYFDLKIATGFVTSIQKDADLILKFSNDSIMILKNLDYLISGTGDGAIGLAASQAQGVNPKFELSIPQLETLSTLQIVKLRLYLRDSYIETELSSRKAEIIKDYSMGFLKKIKSKK